MDVDLQVLETSGDRKRLTPSTSGHSTDSRAAMHHHQLAQNTSSSSSGPSNGQTSQFYHGGRSPYAANHNQSAKTPVRDGNPSAPQAYSGSNMRSKFAAKGATPINTMNNMDWAAASRASYGNQFILVPNSAIYSGIPQMSSFVPQPEQYSYMSPTVYQNFGSVMHGNYSNWPYMLNFDMQDGKQSTWGSTDQKGPQNENAGSLQYLPAPTMDNASLQGYTYANMYPQINSLSLPLQVMKTPSGYIVQDLEALTQQEPAIPRAVPAMWTNPSDLTLAKCLENREGITNVYIRGFLPETTDEMLHGYAARFGKIERCKAIVDLDTGLCKGFGFVQYYSFEPCENAIRGFYYLGYQASFAQKSRNSRLKDLEDKSSTNIYCTNIPIDWTEADLRRHFEPYRVVSEKISRDEKTGVSKEVGFARFESREIAERVLGEFHNATVMENNVKLLLRFADTKAQKLLKQQSNERRAYRAGEYNYSVEVVQGTPSPSMPRTQSANAQLTPSTQQSFNASPTAMGSMDVNWTPASSVSPGFAQMNQPAHGSRPSQSSLSTRSLNELENTPPVYRRGSFANRRSMTDISGGSSKTVVPKSETHEPRSHMSSPRKENIKAESMSPLPSRMETLTPATVV